MSAEDPREKKFERVSHVVDIALKILAALVIPIILWGVRLEVKQAVLASVATAQEKLIGERMNAKEKLLRTEINFCTAGTQRRYNDMSAVRHIVQDNTQKLGALSTGIIAANKRLDDILKFFTKNAK